MWWNNFYVWKNLNIWIKGENLNILEQWNTFVSYFTMETGDFLIIILFLFYFILFFLVYCVHFSSYRWNFRMWAYFWATLSWCYIRFKCSIFYSRLEERFFRSGLIKRKEREKTRKTLELRYLFITVKLVKINHVKHTHTRTQTYTHIT